MASRQPKSEKDCPKCGYPLSMCNCPGTAVGDRNRREAERILRSDKRRKEGR